MAEEVKKPARDMPIGIVSCISFVTVIYVLMALSLVLMVPYTEVRPPAPVRAVCACTRLCSPACLPYTPPRWRTKLLRAPCQHAPLAPPPSMACPPPDCALGGVCRGL